jgi:hypothetical protein
MLKPRSLTSSLEEADEGEEKDQVRHGEVTAGRLRNADESVRDLRSGDHRMERGPDGNEMCFAGRVSLAKGRQMRSLPGRRLGVMAEAGGGVVRAE